VGVLTDEWYDNKALYEMMVELSKGLENTNKEMAATQALIRDYNGLRQKINECEKALFEQHGKAAGGKDAWGYIVGGIGVFIALISFAVK
jgi:hypothetical protein